MNTLLLTPRRLVMALVAAGAIGALGATGAGLVGVRSDAHAQVTTAAAVAPAREHGGFACGGYAQLCRHYCAQWCGGGEYQRGG